MAESVAPMGRGDDQKNEMAGESPGHAASNHMTAA